MKPTPALSKVFPSINQPLPLTRQQSLRLLDALKTSFRTNLDREHGWLPEDQHVASSSTSPAAPPSTGPAQSRRPTDDHVRAILSNPVFKSSVSIPTSGLPAKKLDPMVVFDRAVAQNMMTFNAAHGCMYAKYDEIVQSSTPSISEAIAAVGASQRVLKWMASQGLDRNLDFIMSRRFSFLFTQYMVAENMESTIWAWMSKLMAHPEIPMADSKARLLLFDLIGAKISFSTGSAGNLDTAFESIIQADEMLQGHSLHNPVIMQAWKRLSWAATVDAWKRTKPTESLFDDYFKIGLQGGVGDVQLDRAHLRVHHPAHPEHSSAVEYIFDNKSSLAQYKSMQHKTRDGAMLRTFLLAMDTIKLLAQLGKADEAEGILELLEGNGAGAQVA